MPLGFCEIVDIYRYLSRLSTIGTEISHTHFKCGFEDQIAER